jgi:hypothetical protein
LLEEVETTTKEIDEILPTVMEATTTGMVDDEEIFEILQRDPIMI